MPELPSPPKALLLDIDGVLHVGREPVNGAVGALKALREKVGGIRLLTNTTSRSRAAVTEGLRESGFELGDEDVLTPAALALAYCQEKGLHRVELFVSEALRPDLEGLREAGAGEEADAVLLGDLGDRLDAEILNRAFRWLMAGAELLALGHNRYWRREDGLALDVGAISAALEYGSQVEARVLGKPSAEFFAGEAVMVGDDVEADVGGGLRAGIASVLVRTGKFEARHVAASGIEPTVVIDSIADLPALLD
jgi:HAD superfamily hydrolase (TIGR01458 family)